MACRDEYHNDQNRLYVPSQHRDSGVGCSRIEEVFDILLKKVDAQDETLKEMKIDISEINQKIESHAVAIK